MSWEGCREEPGIFQAQTVRRHRFETPACTHCGAAWALWSGPRADGSSFPRPLLQSGWAWGGSTLPGHPLQNHRTSTGMPPKEKCF